MHDVIRDRGFKMLSGHMEETFTHYRENHGRLLFKPGFFTLKV